MSAAAFFVREAPHVLFGETNLNGTQQMIITMVFYISCVITFLAGFTIMKAEKNSGNATSTSPIIYILMMVCAALAIFFSWAITYLTPLIFTFFTLVDLNNKRKSQTTSFTDYALTLASIVETIVILVVASYPYYSPLIL